jgi:hypothetical protein
MARIEFGGSILAVRAIEDCIRASHKYSEGVNSKLFSHHPEQGEQFVSRTLTKYYEVHPEIDIDHAVSFWDAAYTATDWLWGDTPRVDVLFRYNYATNRAWAYVYGGEPALSLLRDKIVGLTEILARVSSRANLRPETEAIAMQPGVIPATIHDAK